MDITRLGRLFMCSELSVVAALLVLVTAVVVGESFCNSSFGKTGEQRLQKARQNKQSTVEGCFEKAGMPYPPYQLFLRIFKKEKKLEVWARPAKGSKFKLIHKYDICRLSGEIGPKRKQGDLQVPEGFYYISGFNPQSRFHLSLKINYPNSSDKKLGDKNDPGDDIFIHGNCVTIGCVPIQDGPIEELYIMVLDSRLKRRTRTHVHIFPCRMHGKQCKSKMEKLSEKDPELKKFWNTLLPAYKYFEKNRTLPLLTTGRDGYYKIASE